MFLFVVEIADAGAGVDARISFDGAGFDEQLVHQRRLAGATVAADGDVPNVRNVLNHDSIPVPRKEVMSVRRLRMIKLLGGSAPGLSSD